MNNPLIVSCSGEWCDGKINLEKERNYYQAMEGWEKKRAQGGQNHVALRKSLNAFMCNVCMDKMQRGVGAAQATLSFE